ncbi:acyl-CoA/acyl-ACP dehydrogenase|uniref:acyl-CoA dehydrogenase family protein n=1 Tax=Pseudomonas sp. SbOxS1 TaxID=2723884 RepID=UPI0015D13D38|nr:acyl-CoA dehydrogenase family protein [Pseudomonas sp. SbOxS1]NYU03340.1 acyl-CoA/acyl-ACP dehydrogenase [Pseudomonas sp. SbOxS1]
MNYLLNEDQLAFQETAQKFLATHANSALLHRIADRSDGWQDSLANLWQGFAELGFAGLLVPEEYGGIGLDLFDAALIGETLGAAAAPLPFIGHQLACLAIARAGNPEQKAKWLPGLADGSLIGTVALHAETPAWQPAGWQADPGTAGQHTLRFVPVPGHNAPTLIVVGTAGGGLGLVTPDTDGVSRRDTPCIDPAAFLAEIDIDQAQVEPLPGGIEHAAGLLAAGRALVAADACGGTIRCVELAVEYAQVREQFGVQIGQFQAVKHQIADIALEGEPNRPLCWHAAQTTANQDPGFSRHAALAKAHLSDAYLRTARRTIELHGGFGYTWEADLHLYLKRAMFGSAWLGSATQLRRELA